MSTCHSVQAQIAAIRARGEPVCIEDLNAVPRLSKAENMLPAVLELGKKMDGRKNPEDKSGNLFLVSTGTAPPTGCRWSTDQHEAVDSYLKSAGDELVGIHALLRKGRLQLQVQWTTPAFDVLIPELSQIRSCAKSLNLEALWAAENDDRERATIALMDLFLLGRWSGDDQFIIGSLVEIACSSLLMDSIERTLNRCGLEEQSLARLQTELIDMEKKPDMRRAFIGERVHLLDFVTAMKLGKLSPSALASGGQSALSAVPILPNINVSKLLDMQKKSIDALAVRDESALRSMKAVDSEIGTLPEYYYLARIAMSSLTRAVEFWLRDLGTNRALQAGLAAERCRIASGRWPASLEELVPTYLPAIPLDPFDNRPIRYAQVREGIKVWSIGEDQKDNGGDIKRLEPKTGNSVKDRPTDWGWVILNPDLRGRPAPVPTTQKSSP
jgi:hypothetical protein